MANDNVTLTTAYMGEPARGEQEREEQQLSIVEPEAAGSVGAGVWAAVVVVLLVVGGGITAVVAWCCCCRKRSSRRGSVVHSSHSLDARAVPIHAGAQPVGTLPVASHAYQTQASDMSMGAVATAVPVTAHSHLGMYANQNLHNPGRRGGTVLPPVHHNDGKPVKPMPLT